YEFKVRNVKRFLEEGNKARVTIMFRGREITHRELGQQLLDEVVKDVKDVGVVEQPPRMEGRNLFIILAPNAKVAQRARELARQQAQAPSGKGKSAPAPSAEPAPPRPASAEAPVVEASSAPVRSE